MAAEATRRRRAGELLDAIREAVRAELADSGYRGVTFEGVARRAGTSKPVLYRRFDNRADMVIDALVTSRLSTPPAVFSGPLRDDLLGLARGIMDRMGPGGVETFRGIIGEVDDATVARVSGLVMPQVEAWLSEIFERSREAGELGPEPVPAAAVEAIVALVRHQMVFVPGTERASGLERVVDEAMIPLLQATTNMR
ncbi:TetR/AcrR family transcriptional regulator [Demequina sp. NBRC 110053]|uniref:TetR/AcrR family transcriptional regulator n=1 Tax=Demequina sp. NBRC 110053 TaxID=1570342 RepID=UPI0009FD6538|nr:TetR/AcrR family transcriptional regulator [Demequina sp. NBRC 110053]